MIRHTFPHSSRAARRHAWEPCVQGTGKTASSVLGYGNFAPVTGSDLDEGGST
jgi:hypothetical protein